MKIHGVIDMGPHDAKVSWPVRIYLTDGPIEAKLLDDELRERGNNVCRVYPEDFFFQGGRGLVQEPEPRA